MFKPKRQHLLAMLAVATAVVAGAVYAQSSGAAKRNIVARADVSVAGREAIVAEVELPAGGRSGRHTHPGDEISYVSEGEITLLVDGQPPRVVKAGQGFVVPAGVVHEGHNASAAGVKLIGVYHVEKGKPLATPAP